MSSAKPVYDAKGEMQLMTELWDPQLADDPIAFVMFAFPWGKAGTPLEHQKGPRGWQREQLEEVRNHIRQQKRNQGAGKPLEMYRESVSSGRGIGKSAEVSWLTLWAQSTRIGSSVIVTANTEQQLKSRTWAELGKWHTLAINSHWFDRSATALRPAPWFEEAVKRDLKIDTGYYYAQAQLWSEENPDAFAGVHNPNGVMLIFDEASGIPQAIWNVSEGFFTEPVVDRYWFAYSNPRRNTGAFFECFHKNRNYWRRRQIDSRTVEGTDTAIYDKIIDQYGEDSDVARVEVKGQFPRQGDKQFISADVVDGAINRETLEDPAAALHMGVDVARFGDDSSVIRFRRGRDARSIPAFKYKGLDNMQLAYRAAELIDRYNPDTVSVDAGNGTGVIDRLREMGYRVNEVWFGAKSADPGFANKRAELWDRMREWLAGGCIDDDPDLRDDLLGPEYDFAKSGDAIILESKEKMKSRGLASPDNGDALACTFAVRAPRSDMRTSRRGRRRAVAADVDYDIFG